MPSTLVIGSYNAPQKPGLYILELSNCGRVQRTTEVNGVQNPSFVARDSQTGHMYAVNEIDGPGSVTAISTNNVGAFDTCQSHGIAPCHIAIIDSTAFVANYMTGSIAAYELASDGRFGNLLGSYRHEGSGPHPRQESSHMHSVVHAPGTRWVYAADLGSDALLRFSLDALIDGHGLRPSGVSAVPPGSGPRHLAFHRSLPVMYAVCELSCTLMTFTIDKTSGTLTERSSLSTLPPGTHHESLAAAIAVHPDGSRLFISNRGDDSIATYSLDAHGDPTLVGHTWTGGRVPRDITVDLLGRWLLVANQGSGTVTRLSLNKNHQLPRDAHTIARMPSPTSVLFTEDDA